MTDWISQVKEVARKNNYVVVCMDTCPICEIPDVLLKRVVTIGTKLKIEEKEFSGLLTFVCEECSTDLTGLKEKMNVFLRLKKLRFFA